MHEGQFHEYYPDFLVRLQHEGREVGTLILETKGYDERAEAKSQAAQRWVAAVNNDGRYGYWSYQIVYQPSGAATAARQAAAALVAMRH
jgi:type III restriction enzyme